MVTFKICTFVYLNVDYHQQEHFFGREWNDSQFQNIRGGVKVMKFWIVCPLRTLVFGRSKHLRNSSKILANTFSDSLAILKFFFCRRHFFHTALSFEDEPRKARGNPNRNPEWWGDFSQLQIQIKPKSGFEFVPRDTEEFKFNQTLNSNLYREIQRNLSLSIWPVD